MGLTAIVLVLAAVPLLRAQESVTYNRVEREEILRNLREVNPDDHERCRLIEAMFADAGCRDQNFTEQAVPDSDLPNLICTLPGEADSIILVTAHYDAAPGTDGAADNWTGAALLPSLYRSLHGRPLKHTFLFAALAGGADDHAGAKYLADQITKENRDRYRAAVVIDTLGVSFARGWSDERLLIGRLKEVSTSIMLPLEVDEYKNITDEARPFEKKKVPTITIHSVNQFNYENLRDSTDTLDLVKDNEYYEGYMLVAAYLAYLDSMLQ